MEPGLQSVPVIRFGVFEVDLRSGELRKNGLRIKLQDQPFQVLAMLLEKPGQVVTREQLHEKLWPDGTFVDFEHGLHAAIQRLRQALNDSADTPRFIETLPKRGYRFLAPVNALADSVDADHGIQSQTEVRVDGQSGAASPSSTATLATPVTLAPAQGPKWQRWKLVVGAALTVVLLAVVGVWISWKVGPKSVSPLPELQQLTFDAGLTKHPSISPDGKLVVYTSDRAGNGDLDLWLQQVAEGDAVRLTNDRADDSEPAFSSNGTKIAFRSERDGGGIYVVPTVGGEPRRIVGTGHWPQFSPDGTSIAYTRFNGFLEQTISVIPATGGESRDIVRVTGTPVHPLWSPDGKYLLYSASPPPYDNRKRDWWTVSAHGGQPQRTGAFQKIREAGLYLFEPRLWVGNRIYFSGGRGDTVSLWWVTIALDTLQINPVPTRLTTGTNVDQDPSVSNSGQLAFASIQRAPDLWLLPILANKGEIAGTPQRLTRDSAREFHSLSQDGTKLLYSTDRSRHGDDIWLRDLATGEETPVVTNPATVKLFPSFSPDGTEAAYFMLSASGRFSIYMQSLGADGTKKVCEDCAFNAAPRPEWTPDGAGILYSAEHNQMNLLQLATGQRTPFLNSTKLANLYAQFSHDGQWLTIGAFAPDGARKIFTARVRNGVAASEKEWIPVHENVVSAEFPQWSPDDNMVYFLSYHEGAECICARHLDALSKRPVDSTFAVYRFTNARFSGNSWSDFSPLRMRELAVAADKLVFSQTEQTGNVWMIKLPAN